MRRVRARGFIGTQPAEEGGSYREAARRPLVQLDRRAARRSVSRRSATRSADARPVRLQGVSHRRQQLLVVDEVTTADQARALVRRIESALGHALTQPDVEREFHFDAQSRVGRG